MRVVGPLGMRGFNVEGHGVRIELVESGLLRCELAPGARPQSEPEVMSTRLARFHHPVIKRIPATTFPFLTTISPDHPQQKKSSA